MLLSIPFHFPKGCVPWQGPTLFLVLISRNKYRKVRPYLKNWYSMLWNLGFMIISNWENPLFGTNNIKSRNLNQMFNCNTEAEQKRAPILPCKIKSEEACKWEHCWQFFFICFHQLKLSAHYSNLYPMEEYTVQAGLNTKTSIHRNPSTRFLSFIPSLHQ